MYKKPFHSVDLSKYKFLVTGGAGFIGSNIVEYLLKYNAGKVVVIDNLSNGFIENIKPFYSNPAFKFVEGDICNFDTCYEITKDIDYVFHQAALGSVPRSVKDPVATNNANVSGFLNVITASKDNNVKRFVYASSSSVYGDSKELPKVEENIGNPLSPYAVSKLTNELYAHVFQNLYNMEIVGLRYFNVFGPRQNPKGPYAAAMPLFIEAILNNQSPKIFGDGEQTRDFTFVENAVQANIKAMFTDNKECFGKVFNVAVGETTSLNKLLSLLKKISNSNIEAVYCDERPGDIRNSLADISKIKKLIAYNPEVKIEEGLKITFEWFKQTFQI